MDKLFIEDIKIEIDYLDKTVNDISGLVDITNNREVNVYDSAAASMLISQFYNGIENILKLILKMKVLSIPHGGNSHIKLFLMFTEENQDLPNLFTQDIISGFSIIRRFRHYARHGYAYNIDWERLREGMKSVDNLYLVFKENLFNYLKQ